jgi:hypothetical protein
MCIYCHIISYFYWYFLPNEMLCWSSDISFSTFLTWSAVQRKQIPVVYYSILYECFCAQKFVFIKKFVFRRLTLVSVGETCFTLKDFYSVWLFNRLATFVWTYLMKAITETRCATWFWYLRFYCYGRYMIQYAW